MPGRRCAMFSCNNSKMATKAKGNVVIYHSFPKENDPVSATARKEWIRCCDRADEWNPNHCTICSEHFTANDYERDLQNELLGLPIRKKLKKTAVPTVNLSLAAIENCSENIQRHQSLRRKKRRQKDVQDILNNGTGQRLTRQKHRQKDVQDILNNGSGQSLTRQKRRQKDVQEVLNNGCGQTLTRQKRRQKDVQDSLNNGSGQRLTRQKRRQKDVQDILNKGSQSWLTNSNIRKGLPKIELVMCDTLPLADTENNPEDIQRHQKLTPSRKQSAVQGVFNKRSQPRSKNSEICKDLLQIELIMCDNLPLAIVNHPKDIQRHRRLKGRQRQSEDQDIFNNSSQSQSTISQISEDSSQIQLTTCDEKLTMESNYKELLQKYNKLVEQHKLLKSSSKRKIKSLSFQVHHYKRECSKLKRRGKSNLVFAKRKCRRKSDGNSIKVEETQLVDFSNNTVNVCYKISNKYNNTVGNDIVKCNPCKSVKIETELP